MGEVKHDRVQRLTHALLKAQERLAAEQKSHEQSAAANAGTIKRLQDALGRIARGEVESATTRKVATASLMKIAQTALKAESSHGA